MKSIGVTNQGGHGRIGSLFLKLSRFGIAGWCLSFILFILLIIVVALNTLKQPQVMIVDGDGNFLGYVNFTNSLARTDSEILSSAKKFGSCFWSLNAATITDDVGCALKMSDTMPFNDSLSQRDKYLENLERSNFIAVVRNANNRTSVSFDDNNTYIVDGNITRQRKNEEGELVFDAFGSPVMDHYVRVVVSGEIVVLGTKKKVKEFKQELTLRIVPRNSFDHLGVMVSDESNI
ncbi:hypothetical protein [Shewanella algae]|uniref:hypothetical protein n=1 Tax=Shewanella algae TaxID=38313 RepID=UPI0031F5AEA0